MSIEAQHGSALKAPGFPEDPAQFRTYMRERLRRELPSFLQPARYDWRAALPRNANGKLDRTALRASLGDK